MKRWMGRHRYLATISSKNIKCVLDDFKDTYCMQGSRSTSYWHGWKNPFTACNGDWDIQWWRNSCPVSRHKQMTLSELLKKTSRKMGCCEVMRFPYIYIYIYDCSLYNSGYVVLKASVRDFSLVKWRRFAGCLCAWAEPAASCILTVPFCAILESHLFLGIGAAL